MPQVVHGKIPPAVVVGLIAVAAVALDLGLHDRSWEHAFIVGGMTALAGAATSVITRRSPLAIAAAATLAVWPLPHLIPTGFLLVACAVGAVLLLPAGLGRMEAAGALVAAAAMSLFLFGTSTAVVVGGVVAAGLVLARPNSPTEGTLRFLRTAALFLPTAGMALALVVNAATRRAEHLSAAEAVYVGTALAGLWLLVCFALLGLGTLLESSDARQQPAWNAVSLGAGIVAASVTNLNADAVLAGFGAVAVPVATLAVLASARLALVWPRLRHPLPFLALLASGLQWGLKI